MKNYCIRTTSVNPWDNLALEKVLAAQLKEGDLLLYLWQNDRTVVIGRNQNALRECRAGLLEEEGGFLARRATGGGAVYHDLGNLCFTFAASPERYDLKRQMKVVMNACAKFGIRTQLSGRNDLITQEGFKFSGNAFSVTSSCSLQHGTIMIDVDREMLRRYLTPSVLKLKAKGIQSVQSRVCNLKELSPSVTVEKMIQALEEAFEAEYGACERLREEDFEAERKTEYQLFSSWDWRYGKTPACQVEYEGLLSWGEIQVRLELKGMRITKCHVYSDALDTQLPQMLETLLTGKRFDLQDLEVPWKLPGAGEAEKAEGGTAAPKESGASAEEEQVMRLQEALLWLKKETGPYVAGPVSNDSI